jgi:hypothetical protein
MYNMSSQFGNKIISASTGSAFIVISIFMSFSLTSTDAQNMTNQTGGQQQQPTTGAESIISTICAQEASETGVTNSSSQAGVEIRCLLREARNAVSADAADQAIQLINTAESKLSAALGGANNNSTS